MARLPQTADREPKRVVGYMLPESVIRAIAVEAMERRCWPANVAEEALREYLDRRQPARKHRTRQSTRRTRAAGA